MNVPPSTPLDALKNAAARYRAILRNCEVGSTPEVQREWDDRIMTAEVALEAALLEAEVMKPDDAIQSISVSSNVVVVLFEDGRTYHV
jgi:hypothetical protein